MIPFTINFKIPKIYSTNHTSNIRTRSILEKFFCFFKRVPPLRPYLILWTLAKNYRAFYLFVFCNIPFYGDNHHDDPVLLILNNQDAPISSLYTVYTHRVLCSHIVWHWGKFSHSHKCANGYIISTYVKLIKNALFFLFTSCLFLYVYCTLCVFHDSIKFETKYNNKRL